MKQVTISYILSDGTGDIIILNQHEAVIHFQKILNLNNIVTYHATVIEKPVYVYRGLPCTVGRWSVSGNDTFNLSGGVLEWCYDEEDAQKVLEEMKEYPQFKDLTIYNHEEI